MASVTISGSSSKIAMLLAMADIIDNEINEHAVEQYEELLALLLTLGKKYQDKMLEYHYQNTERAIAAWNDEKPVVSFQATAKDFTGGWVIEVADEENKAQLENAIGWMEELKAPVKLR